MIRNLGTLRGHEEDRVWYVSWSHNGRHLASCGEDRVVRLWTHDSWEGDKISEVRCVSTLEEAQSRTIRACEWSPDDQYIACASFDGSVAIWKRRGKSLENWDQLATLEGHENEVKSVSWSFDGKYIATCGRDKKVWVWEDLGEGEFECVAMLEGHSQDVKFVKFHHSSLVLFSSSYDDTIKIWKDDGSGDWLCSATLKGHESTVWGLSLAYRMPCMISVSNDSNIIFWETSDESLTTSWRQTYRISDAHTQPIYSVDWSHDHGHIVTAAGDNRINLMKYSKDQGVSREFSISDAHDSDINCIRWNPNTSFQHLIATCGDDGCVKIWSLEM